MESLERLKSLHQDLVNFSTIRLVNIDRLWQQLEASVQDFRRLLDPPSQESIKTDSLGSRKIVIDGEEYAVSDDLLHLGRTVATALSLDEQGAIRVIIETQGTSFHLDSSIVRDVVVKYQDRNDYLLQDLRIVLQEAVDRVVDDTWQDGFHDVVQGILDVKSGFRNNGSAFARKCMKALEDIEKRQHKIGEEIQGRKLLEQQYGADAYETFEFQKASLFKQHEALAAILAYLFKGNFTTSEDLRKLITIPRSWNRLDYYLIHYLPAFSAAFRQYGSPDHSSSKDDAISINDSLARPDLSGDRAVLQPFQAVLSLWWVVEYSGWFREPVSEGPGADARVRSVKIALENQALEFLLSLCTSMNFDPWRHPARQEIVSLLLSEASGLSLEEELTSDFFRMLFMECLETFAESWITNMPDSIRQLKNEEDDQRLLQMTAMQSGLELSAGEEVTGRLHLECLLVLISFAFENRPLPAEELFWQDPEGNLAGFVQWASKRQTVPRVGAFCEMLCSISEGPNCAAAAHNFLLEGSTSTSRSRRNPSMNYAQMFAELSLYAHKVHERATNTQVPHLRKILPTDMNELESPVMLSCYLRLITHLCRQTNLTRELIFSNTTTDLVQNLLMLSSGPIPSYLRGSIFQTITALLTEKTSEIGFTMWKVVDSWAASGNAPFEVTIAKTDQPILPSMRVLQNTLISISDSFDQSDAFLVLLSTLMAPSPDDLTDGPILHFPSDLGASYRPPGISPYVDFVLGQLFVKRIPELSDQMQSRILLLHCLEFTASCLNSFNENYVAMVDRPSSTITPPTWDGTISYTTYAQTHPFARTMKWLFSNDASKALLAATHQDAHEIESAQFRSPLVLALESCIDVINLVLDNQPTYIDIVRPLVTDLERDTLVPPSAITAFEESMSARPELIFDLCSYAASENYGLVFRALNLLDSLSRSKKLNSFFIQRGTSGSKLNRVIDMLGPNSSDLLPTCAALASRLGYDIRELEEESASPGYIIKDTILSFFNRCLASHSDLPNVAHLLLGFIRIGHRLDIAPDSMLETGTSVFNAVLSLALDYPIGDNTSDTWSWLLHIKTACIRVLQNLWSSQISSAITLSQLRKFKFLARQFAGLITVTRGTSWDRMTIYDPGFWLRLGKPSEGLLEFLEHRACLYDYANTEIRDITASKLTSLQKQWLSTMFGKSTSLEGVPMTHANMYELFDFLDIEIAVNLNLNPSKNFSDFDPESLKSDATEDSPSLYDIELIREVLRHHISQLTSSANNKPSADDEIEIKKEADTIIDFLLAKNRLSRILLARRSALHNLVNMVISALECCPMEPGPKIQFILQMLQIILPKLDAFVLNDAEECIELARAADVLLLSLTQLSSSQISGRIENSIADRLFQLFRICIEGINMAESNSALRTILYNICSQYLTRILGASEANRRARRNSLDCVRSSGSRLVNTLSDDAEDGLDTSKPAALNLLGLLVSLARSEKSPFMVDSLIRANALELLIEPIKQVAAEFQESVPAARMYLLTVLEARMHLLLQISRTREGAGCILDAGLLQAVRESMIFRADPDLGMDVDNADALHHYYELVSSVLRLLVSTFLSRGLQNEQCQFLMRGFLQDYRPNMVGLFKRFNGVNGKAAARSQDLLKEIVNAYVALAAMSGFVDFEEETNGGLGSVGGGIHAFS